MKNKIPIKQAYTQFPFRRPGPGHFQTQNIETSKIKLFNFASKPIPQGQAVDWASIEAIAVSDSSHQGVIFIQTGRGSVVVKGTPHAPQQTFLHSLARVLQVGVPHARIVRWDDAEFRTLTHELQRYTFMDSSLSALVKARLDRPYLIIMEYVPGVTLSEVGAGRAQKVLSSFDPQSRNRMIRVGLTVGMDLLVNNRSRFPLPLWAWTDRGIEHFILRTNPSFLDTTKELRDPNNLNFEYEMFYAVDNRYDFFDDAQPELMDIQIRRYYVKMEEFLNDLFMEMKQVMNALLDPLYETQEQQMEVLQDFKNLVERLTSYQVKDMTLLQIMLGIILSIDNIVAIGPSNMELLIASHSIDEQKDFKDQWNSNLLKVNNNFIGSIILIFQKFIELNKDVMQWARDMTLNTYAYDAHLLKTMLLSNKLTRDIMGEQEEMKYLDNDEQLNDKIVDNYDDEIMEQELTNNQLDQRIKDIFDIDLGQIKVKKQMNQENQQQQIQSQLQQSQLQQSQLQQSQLQQSQLQQSQLQQSQLQQSQQQSQVNSNIRIK